MNVACFFNGPYLGGAERSFISQVKSLSSRKNVNIDFVVPYLVHTNEAKVLLEEIHHYGFSDDHINTFKFNSKLFSVSRTWPLLKIFSVIQGFISTLISLNKYSFRRHKVWWVNGNKIGFVCLIFAYLTGFRGEFIWHFRDYPAVGRKWRFVWLPLKLPKLFQLTLVGNSYSVTEALDKLNVSEKTHTLYNKVHDTVIRKEIASEGQKTIGVVAMMAPWKGLHSIIMFSALYEKELRAMGIERLVFYGGDLYKTQGDHSNYFSELKYLKEKLEASIVSFAGLCPPEKIFSEIDILIHPSLRAEPFGRVIVEAMASSVPVISSGLGGAGELIQDKVDGVLYNINDNDSLLSAVGFALNNDSSLIENGLLKFHVISEKFEQQLSSLFQD